MSRRGKMLVILGAQYGDEGKGAISAYLANEYDVHIRAGSPQAEHTFTWHGEKHTMKQIPCGWINPNARIVIGRGALINMKNLKEEIEHIQRFYPDFLNRLYIDSMAGVVDEKFVEQENGEHGEAHKRIGSTGEGIGPARVARIMRNPEEFYHYGKVDPYFPDSPCDTPELIAKWQDAGLNVMLEGTQGSALSLIHGPWPFVTSNDISAAQLLSECGIAPNRLTNVMLIARTYPMRVPGNSGPMKNEITWEELSERTGKQLKEYGMVIKKPLRIAEWDQELFDRAILLNGPTSVALTFMDYLDPALENVTDMGVLIKNQAFLKFIKNNIPTDIHVAMVRTGGLESSVVDFGNR